MIQPSFEDLRAAYSGKRVLVTGHTGFKGGWLAMWLAALDAEVIGIGLPASTEPSLFEDARITEITQSLIGDVRDLGVCRRLLRENRPDAIFHLAAQPLVRLSYDEPLATLGTNVMGTANVLEAVRQEACRCAVVVVTSDKCYENREWVHGYRETDPLGGHDVYSMSKGAAELVVESWRRSFFPPSRFAAHGVALASVRAGNVIGGGDWAMDRIVPDTIRSLLRGKAALVRRPEAVRPWQHVLEPLGGYLLLGAHLMREGAERFCEAWNFGPALDGACSVRCLVEAIIASWGAGEWVSGQEENARHEAGLLRLAIEKAHARLAWAPRWGLLDAAEQTVAWYRAHSRGARGKELRELSFRQIAAFTGGYVRSRA